MIRYALIGAGMMGQEQRVDCPVMTAAALKVMPT